MSKKTSSSTQKNEIKNEEDELERQFLECNFDDLPLPKEELKNYQFEVKEVMKSGCNLQIAEYSLLQYDIDKELKDLKENYIELKKNIRKDEVDEEIQLYFNNLQNNIKPKDEDGENDNNKEDNNSKNYYEEEANEVMEEKENYLDILQNKPQIDKQQIKNDIMGLFKKIMDKHQKASEFKEAKENYMKKRDALIEAALRLVKKIVNDEEEYKKFYKGYYNKEYEE